MKRLAIIAPLLLASMPANADFLQDLFAPAAVIRNFRIAHLHPPGRFIHGHIAAERGAGGFIALASYYGGVGERLNARTASGERFNALGLTCAHRSLPFGSRLLVSHAGRSVVVRVNDRGPNIRTGRNLDLSRGAAERLGLIKQGVGRVSVTRLD